MVWARKALECRGVPCCVLVVCIPTCVWLEHLMCLEPFQRLQIFINNGLLLAPFCLGFLSYSSAVNMKLFKIYQQNTFPLHISASKLIADATSFDASVPCIVFYQENSCEGFLDMVTFVCSLKLKILECLTDFS